MCGFAGARGVAWVGQAATGPGGQCQVCGTEMAKDIVRWHEVPHGAPPRLLGFQRRLFDVRVRLEGVRLIGGACFAVLVFIGLAVVLDLRDAGNQSGQQFDAAMETAARGLGGTFNSGGLPVSATICFGVGGGGSDQRS